MPFSASSPIERSLTEGSRKVEDLLGEDDPHVGELDEMLGARVGVRPRVDQHGRPLLRGDHDRDPGAEDAREAPHVEKGRSEDGTGVSRRHDRRRLAFPDRADGANERRVGLGPHRLGGLLLHGDLLGRGHELQPVGVERPRPEEHGLDRGRGGLDGARDHLVRSVVAAECVDGDANDRAGGPDGVDWPVRARQASPYGAGARSGWTSRPRYVLHVGQTRCDCFGEPQFSQVETRGAEIACWARRLSRRAFEVFRFGTAMSGRQCTCLPGGIRRPNPPA